MKLEQIDTSTTAGKIHVMELAEQGRKVAARALRSSQSWQEAPAPAWDWCAGEYAIIAEPVGPDEVWVVVPFDPEVKYGLVMNQKSADYFRSKGETVVRYVRAD